MSKKCNNFDDQEFLDDEFEDTFEDDFDPHKKNKKKDDLKTQKKTKTKKKNLEQVEFKQKLIAPLILVTSILISLLFYLLS